MARDDIVEQRIVRAGELAAAMTELREQINANRQTLRIFQKDGMLTDEQSAWLEGFYPEKSRASLEEQIANAEARAAALREKAAKAQAEPEPVAA